MRRLSIFQIVGNSMVVSIAGLFVPLTAQTSHD
jgi:hypothetical protein